MILDRNTNIRRSENTIAIISIGGSTHMLYLFTNMFVCVCSGILFNL